MGKRRRHPAREWACSTVCSIMKERYDINLSKGRNPCYLLGRLIGSGHVVLENKQILNKRQSEEALMVVIEKLSNHYKTPIKVDCNTVIHNVGPKEGTKVREFSFYDSPEWFLLRHEVFKKYDKKCMRCGSTNNIEVDHILPKSKFPDKALDFDNMQVLCSTCNKWKSNTKFHDFREEGH